MEHQKSQGEPGHAKVMVKAHPRPPFADAAQVLTLDAPTGASLLEDTDVVEVDGTVTSRAGDVKGVRHPAAAGLHGDPGAYREELVNALFAGDVDDGRCRVASALVRGRSLRRSTVYWLPTLEDGDNWRR